MTERETLDLYEATGALLRGHFRLTSGLHSDVYLQSALVLQHPVHAAALGAALAAPFRNDGIQTVLAPAIGGILVAHEVGRALGVRALFTEREDGVMRLRRGFALAPGERCLVVEDVMTTGGSIREVATCVEALGGTVVGVGSLIDRSGGSTNFSVKRATLAQPTILWFINTDLGPAAGYRTKMSPENQITVLPKSQQHIINPTNPRRALNDRIKDRLHVGGRATDDAEHL